MNIEVSPAVLVLIPALVGGIAVPVINLLKKAFKWTDPRANLWLAFGTSVILAILALVITGYFTAPLITPEVIIGWIAETFAVATVIYKGITKEQAPAKPETVINIPLVNPPPGSGSLPKKE